MDDREETTGGSMKAPDRPVHLELEARKTLMAPNVCGFYFPGRMETRIAADLRENTLVWGTSHGLAGIKRPCS
jgi:hypothetical protein